MTSDSFWAIASYWFVLAEWMAITLVLFFDCVWVYGRTRRVYAWALEDGDGKRSIARTRLKIASWFLVVAICALVTVLLAAYASIFVEQNYEAPSILNMLTRQVLILMLFGIWRAKRNNVYQIKAVEAREKMLKERLDEQRSSASLRPPREARDSTDLEE